MMRYVKMSNLICPDLKKKRKKIIFSKVTIKIADNIVNGYFNGQKTKGK